MRRPQACSGDGCDGYGWVDDAEVDGSRFVRPCAVCRPELFQRWRSRRLDPEIEQPKPGKAKAAEPALPLAEQQRTMDDARADFR